MTLTLEIDLFFENLKVADNFSTVSARAMIFCINIPFDKIFLVVLDVNILVLIFDFFLELTFTMVKLLNDKYQSFHIARVIISCDNIFLLVLFAL